MTNEVDAALERVRGELVTIERALRTLKDSINQRSGAVGSGTVGMQSIWGAAEKDSELPSWNDIDRVLSRELALPEYGALGPPDEETRVGDRFTRSVPGTPSWNDIDRVLSTELSLPEYGALRPPDEETRLGDRTTEKGPEAPRWGDLTRALQGELWLPEFGALLPSENEL
jgi:hypothetical protein